MKKGLIICGYPGIGKSSIAGWNNCIDLESSYFSHDKQGREISPMDWQSTYCKLAMDLACQGYTVMVSTHEGVRVEFKKLKIHRRYKDIPIVIFCPRLGMKEEWAIRLVNRYIKTNNEKDLRAFNGAIGLWDINMEHMGKQQFPIYHPESIDYDLRDYILQIRKKEGCDDEETNSSLEQVAGVEESCLDVPVVEESTDISRDHSE